MFAAPPPFTRSARRPKALAETGRSFSFPPDFLLLFRFAGIVITSATGDIFHGQTWQAWKTEEKTPCAGESCAPRMRDAVAMEREQPRAAFEWR